MDYSTPGLPVHHQLPEFTQTHVLIHPVNIQLSGSLMWRAASLNTLFFFCSLFTETWTPETERWEWSAWWSARTLGDRQNLFCVEGERAVMLKY